jgi:hypothetical protein
MSKDVEVREAESILVPALGTQVDLAKPGEVGTALRDIQALEGRFREVKRILKGALVAHWSTGGLRKTYTIEGGRKVVITGGPEKLYDAEAIRDELLAAGMPDERVSEIVVETVSYAVRAVEAKAAAASNPEYAAIIERNTTVIEKPYDAAVK